MIRLMQQPSSGTQNASTLHPKRVYNRYMTCRQIGVGSTATVNLALDTVHQRGVALKSVKKSRISRLKVQQEVRIQSLVSKHPNIASIYSAFETPDCYMLVEEYMPNGDLFEVIKPDVGMSEKNVMGFAREFASAVAYMHQNDVVHRDLKPENVCLSDANSCRIIDFGHAAVIHECHQQDYIGTLPYMAPELLAGESRKTPIDFKKTDIFAFGMTLFVMATGKFPWKSATMDDQEYAYFAVGGAGPCHRQRWASFSPDFARLLRGTMCPNITQRWTAAEALGFIETMQKDAILSLPSVSSSDSVASLANMPQTPSQSSSIAKSYPSPPSEPVPSARSSNFDNLKRPAPYKIQRPTKAANHMVVDILTPDASPQQSPTRRSASPPFRHKFLPLSSMFRRRSSS